MTATETKFTPAPWTVNVARLSDKSINVAHVIGPKGQGIAQVGVYGEDETIANANLMAAAPAAFAALVKAQAVIADTAPMVAPVVDLLHEIAAVLRIARGA